MLVPFVIPSVQIGDWSMHLLLHAPAGHLIEFHIGLTRGVSTIAHVRAQFDVLVITIHGPVGSHLRLCGLMGSLSLFRFISETSDVFALRETPNDPNALLAHAVVASWKRTSWLARWPGRQSVACRQPAAASGPGTDSHPHQSTPLPCRFGRPAWPPHLTIAVPSAQSALTGPAYTIMH